MIRPSVPGEAHLSFALGRLPAISDVALSGSGEELLLNAVLDTGSTYCVISRPRASHLGFDSENRLGTHRVQGVGGVVTMDRHRFEYVQVGTARAYGVEFLVGDALPGLMLLGRSFIGKFTTTLDLDAGRVIFRPRVTDRWGRPVSLT